MKKYYLIILLVMALKSFGQNHFIGMKGGMDASTIIANKFFDNTGYRMGFSGGLTYQYLFQKGFLLGVDILYDQKGFTSSERYVNPKGGFSTFYDKNGNVIGEWLISKYSYNYLSVPFKAGFQFGKKLCGVFNFGIVPSMLLSAKSITPVVLRFPVIENYTDNGKGNYKRMHFAGLAEIGMGYNLKGNFWLTSSLAYQQDMYEIDKGGYGGIYYNRDIILRGMTFCLGVKWAIRK